MCWKNLKNTFSSQVAITYLKNKRQFKFEDIADSSGNTSEFFPMAWPMVIG